MIAPSDLKAEARKYRNENERFRRFLKNRADPDDLDKRFLDLHNDLFRDYDCSKCSNCCKEYSITLEDEEVSRIAAYLGLTNAAFTDKYLVLTENGYESKTPCRLLGADGRCVVQVCKPAECSGFPYTNKPDRLMSLHGVMSSAEVCPVVFEIVTRLKDIYHFAN